MSVSFVSRVPVAQEATQRNKRLTLNAIGLEMSGHVKERTPVETGRLRASIAWAADGQTQRHRATETGLDGSVTTVEYEVTAPKDSAVIGTNVEYALYVHENIGANFKRGGAKFLEWTLRDKRSRIEELVRRGMRGELRTQ